MYTTGTALLEAFNEMGIDFLFANFGSDHPGLVEAIAAARAAGRPVPQVLTCPNEMVGLSAAHGHAMVSGRAQGVVVHVECGTQALAGAVHNADKGRIPVLIFAGASPFTQDGELKGSRNEFIQWIQDVHDQRGIVRGYMRYDNELRTGHNVKQIVNRALQFAHSDPQGPVYLMAAREVLEAEVPPVSLEPSHWQPVEPMALPPGIAEEIAGALANAQRPLIVTSFVGRRPAAVDALVELCHQVGIGVLESVPTRMNFPHDDPLYQGGQWNHPVQNEALAEADVIIVVDSDVPWIPAVSRPAEKAAIYHIDVDPLKQQIPLWYLPTSRSLRADAETALRQIVAALTLRGVDDAARAKRLAHYEARHAERARRLSAAEQPAGGALTAEFVMARLRTAIDADAIIVNEAISNYHIVFDHLARTRPGTMFASGGGSLGWNGGAAIGAKLAAPEREIIAITGDGSYLFTVPASVHWMARRYDTPFLQVVLNNGGWKSPKLSTLAVHPNGFASRAETIDTGFEPAPDHGGIAAAAGGAFARVVARPGELDAAIAEALSAVRDEGRCAVLDVRLAHH